MKSVRDPRTTEALATRWAAEAQGQIGRPYKEQEVALLQAVVRGTNDVGELRKLLQHFAARFESFSDSLSSELDIIADERPDETAKSLTELEGFLAALRHGIDEILDLIPAPSPDPVRTPDHRACCPRRTEAQ